MMESIRDRIQALEGVVNELQSQRKSVQRRLRLWQGVACVLAALGLLILPLKAGTAQEGQPPPSLAEKVAALEAKITALEFKLAPFSREGNDIFLTGANLHIRNGLGATNGNPAEPWNPNPGVTKTNGLGNLIVGYNEARGYGHDDRSGSHNIVVGSFHRFSSYGGLVAGSAHTISGPSASVTGGEFNTASGPFASISGGQCNTASGYCSSISGGLAHSASGAVSSISGGSWRSATTISSWSAGELSSGP
ncbi:MAG: hypothetical protein HY320_02830 [Armatimonadetes bacterium]|nr:hypothetical protein [Armatimonadota bacterium]